MSLFLTRQEVAELTGARTRAGQVRNLVRNGIRHTINASGWPVVTRTAIEGGAQSAATTTSTWKPNKAA